MYQYAQFLLIQTFCTLYEYKSSQHQVVVTLRAEIWDARRYLENLVQKLLKTIKFCKICFLEL